ncbi:MAG: winged helix-turn-helix transcriptional regulator [Candidatus Diapherotrites archaeon]
MEDLEEALVLDTRRKIYKTIEASPGLHFREIQRRTGMAIGSLQYHLEQLEKKNLIHAQKETKFIRYYAVRQTLTADKNMISLLRQDSVRKIVLFLLENKAVNNQKLSKAINLSPSTTSWHLEKLLSQGVVEKRKRGRKTFFKISNPNEIAAILIGHKKSFLDELVDNFAEVWEEI